MGHRHGAGDLASVPARPRNRWCLVAPALVYRPPCSPINPLLIGSLRLYHHLSEDPPCTFSTLTAAVWSLHPCTHALMACIV